MEIEKYCDHNFFPKIGDRIKGALLIRDDPPNAIKERSLKKASILHLKILLFDAVQKDDNGVDNSAIDNKKMMRGTQDTSEVMCWNFIKPN